MYRRSRIGVLSKLLLALLIFIGTLPLGGGQASSAVGFEIINWVRGETKPAEPSRVTTRTVNIEVDFTGISEDELRNFYYVITEVNSGIVRSSDGRIPERHPNIRQRLVFYDVELMEGLNKIEVFYNSPQNKKDTAWIEYTEIASIQNLMVDDQPFANGMFLPAANGISRIFIDGEAPNTNVMTAYSTLNPEGTMTSVFYSSGRFTYTAGEGRVDLELRPGDNMITFIASNPYKTYRTERQFVFNNGDAFLYNTKVNVPNDSDLRRPDVNELFLEPVFWAANASGDYKFEITTDVKLNLNSDGDIVEDEVTLSLNGNDIASIEFIQVGTNYDYIVTRPNGTVVHNGRVSGEVVLGEYVKLAGVRIPGIFVDEMENNQNLQIEFIGAGNSSTQSFYFTFYSSYIPTVRSVRIDGGTEFKLGSDNTILQESPVLHVITTNDVDGVRVYREVVSRDGTSSRVLIHESTETRPNGYTVRLNQNHLPEGRNLLHFVPFVNRRGGVIEEYTAGALRYWVNYMPSPYVSITNIYNGQIFNEENKPPQFLKLVPINIPREQWGDILIKLNSNTAAVNSTDDTIHPSLSEIQFSLSRRGWTLVPGYNELIIEIYPKDSINNEEPITTIRYDLYYFEDNMPEVVNLELESDEGFFRDPNGQNRYYTQKRSASFSTFVRNADSVEFRYYYMDGNDEQQFASAVYRWDGSKFVLDTNQNWELTKVASIIPRVEPDQSRTSRGAATFFVTPTELNGTGSYTLEVITSTSAQYIEIVREPASLVVHYPIIDQATNTATINGNYTRLYVEAERADRVELGNGLVQEKPIQMKNNEDETIEVYVFDINGLKRGRNQINITVVRGEQSETATITLMNAETPVPGAVYKQSISSPRIRAFDRNLELQFPKGTVLMRNDVRAADQVLSPEREIFVGIADPVDGRVDKVLHPLEHETKGEHSVSPFASKGREWDRARDDLMKPDRFRAVSHLYWIDAGMIDTEGGSYPYERDHEFYRRDRNNINDVIVPSQPGTLTLAYDPNIVEAAWRYITVHHYGYNEDHTGSKRYEWKNIGGVVDTKKHTITVPFEEFGYYVVTYMEHSFDDIISDRNNRNDHWAKDFLETLYAKGMMKPKEEERFSANDPISRGEFVTLIVKAFEIPLNYKMETDHLNSNQQWRGMFDDVREIDPSNLAGLYSYKYIETAARAGIVRGQTQRRFSPNDNISRQDAAAIIARAAELKLQTNDDRIMKDLNKDFTDAADIADYARAAVHAVVKEDIMSGKPNYTGSTGETTYYFDPRSSMTRAEAAVIIMKVMLQNKRIPYL